MKFEKQYNAGSVAHTHKRIRFWFSDQVCQTFVSQTVGRYPCTFYVKVTEELLNSQNQILLLLKTSVKNAPKRRNCSLKFKFQLKVFEPDICSLTFSLVYSNCISRWLNEWKL